MNKLILSVAVLAAGVAAAHGHGGGFGGGGWRGGGEFHGARSNNWGGGGWGGGWRGPAYVAPRPVFVAPRPVFVPPRPIYVAPRPVYVAPRPVYRPAYGYTVNPYGSVGFTASLPFGAVTVMLGSQPYYFGGGTFYVSNGQGYSVVDAPIGAVVSQLPEGAQQQVINGYTYASYGNAWFVWDGNQGAWVVVQCPY